MEKLSIISHIPTSKGMLTKMKNEILDNILDGELDVLDARGKLNAMKHLIEEIMKDEEFVERCVDECMLYGTHEEIKRDTGKFQLSEVGVKYDYSVCNHPQWVRLVEEEKKIVEKRKNIEKYLQELRDKEEYIDTSTGELCEIYPPKRTSTTTIKITMNK